MKSKYESAITLIALMITIIVLLILAGITISLTMGKNGILERSQQTGLENKKAEIQETIQFAIMEIEMELASNQKGEELNKNLVQKLPNKIQGIIIHEDMTGEYQKYKYYIDEHYNVHILEKIEQSITELALDKKEIIIALTEQKNVNVENTASIRVITENVLPNQYRWHIQEEAIATIDSEGNIIAKAMGNTLIECRSLDGERIYATCDLIVENREYLYYNGMSLIDFENPLCGSHGVLTGVPYFREEYIYANFSNKNYPDQVQNLNLLTKSKIDFSQYKGVGVKEAIDINGKGGESSIAFVQKKTIDQSWGAIEYDNSIGDYTCYKAEMILRVDGSKYKEIKDYNEEAYLNKIVSVGEYKSGIKSDLNSYIYEIFLVK